MVAFLERIVGKIKKWKGDAEAPQSFYTKDLFSGRHYDIGDHTYGCPTVIQWDDSTNLHIGKYCSIAEKVTILLGGNHRTDWVTTYPFNVLSGHFPEAEGIKGHPASKGDVWIGNDVWIGCGATILSGVHIGDGAVVGAESVVSKDVEPYAVVVGNPSRMIKKRFDEDTIRALLEIRWWNWDENKINQEMRYLCSSSIQEFIGRNQIRKSLS